VLLAYYIATINIENAFHDATLDPDDGIGKEKYLPFDGIVLTDTFQLGETDASEKMFSEMFPQNSDRVEKQKKAPLRVIIGNPPYSVGQKSANDNAQNQTYPKLDKRITNTYAANSSTDKARALYDAYIKAFRWSTDRLDKSGGIICFISNGTWLDGTTASGFRKTIEREFSSIYVFNLRGNQRTSGELSRKEGGKIFGSGSRTPISITLLVKNPDIKNEKATILYHDIGDYLDREEKLKIIKNLKSFGNNEMPTIQISPNTEGDWVNFRNNVFETFIGLSGKGKNDNGFFVTNSNGVITNRDGWVYNFSPKGLSNQMSLMIEQFNETSKKLKIALQANSKIDVKEYIKNQNTIIKWDAKLIDHAEKGIIHTYFDDEVRTSIYRPFFKQFHYFNKDFNWSRCLQHKYYPKSSSINLLITVTGNGSNIPFSVFLTNCIADRQVISNGQSFPLYYYEENTSAQKRMFDTEGEGDYIRRDGVSDFILERAKIQYGKNVTKEDIFYYVYGFLHSPEYREMFANDLKKMLPRLPLVEDVRDFWAFSKAGRQLAELHLNYESVAAYEGVTVKKPDVDYRITPDEMYRVTKMRFPKKDQKDTIIYNSIFTIENIPAKAYEYVVNGKSAIEWIMERYQVTVHKDSGIKNDPNDWSTEVGKPSYIFDLLLSVINVSVQTVEIVEGLPRVRFE
jgi:predicted helicase